MEGSSMAPPPVSPGTAGRRMSPRDRLGHMLTQPSVAARGLAADRLSWILPLAVLAVATWIPAQIPELREMELERQRAQVEKVIDRGFLPAEAGQEMLARFDDQSSPTTVQRIGQLALGANLLALLRLLFPGLLLWIGLRFVMEGRARYLSVVSVLAFTGLPAAIREIVRAPLQLAKGGLDVYFSPAILTGTESVAGYALNQLDLFDVWILALLIPALAEVGNISRGRAAGLVLPLWAIFTLLKIGYAATPFGLGV